MRILAYCLFGVGVFVSMLNIYRTILRSIILRLLQREYRRDMLYLLIGSLFLVLWLVYFQLPRMLWWTALILALFCTDKIHSAIVSSMRHARRGLRKRSAGRATMCPNYAFERSGQALLQARLGLEEVLCAFGALTRHWPVAQRVR
jgi:hypothetical protein